MTHRNPFPLRLPHSSPLLSYFLFSSLLYLCRYLPPCMYFSVFLPIILYISVYLPIYLCPSPCATPKRSSIFLLPPAVQKHLAEGERADTSPLARLGILERGAIYLSRPRRVRGTASLSGHARIDGEVCVAGQTETCCCF